MTETEYRRLRAEAKARYRADLEAIERVKEMSEAHKRPRVSRASESTMGPNTDPLPAATSAAALGTDLSGFDPLERTGAERSAKRRRGSLDKTIREVVANIEVGVFTIKDVERKLSDPTVDRSSVSSVLKRLADSEELEVVVKGTGRRPTTYRKAA